MGKPRGNFIIRLADGIWLTMENAHDVPAGVKKENTSKAPHKTFLPPRCVKQRRDGLDSSRAAEGGREAGRDNKQKPRSAQGSKVGGVTFVSLPSYQPLFVSAPNVRGKGV